MGVKEPQTEAAEESHLFVSAFVIVFLLGFWQNRQLLKNDEQFKYEKRITSIKSNMRHKE